MKLLAAAAAVLVLSATAVAGSARNVDVLRTFAAQLPKVKKQTTVPILLPKTLPLGGNYKVYATGLGGRNSWDLELAGAPNCLGANACFVASFEGKRGGKLPGRANLHLAKGDRAIYHHFTCGGSCSPTSFWFTHAGVLYSWQAKDLPKDEQAVLTHMANDAIAAGPR